VHCTQSRPSSNVKVKGQRSRSPGTKNEKVRHFVRELTSGARSPCGIFFPGTVLGVLRRWKNQRVLSNLGNIFLTGR